MMWKYFFLTTSIVFVITPIFGQEQRDWYVFSQDLSSLTKCLEYHLRSGEVELSHNGPHTLKDTACIIASRFFENSFQNNHFSEVIKKFLSELKTQQNDLFENNQVPGNAEEAIKAALENCAAVPAEPPHFDAEPPELARVLNFILVDWLLPARLMVETAEGRMLLRNYANEAREALDQALLSIDDMESFRSQMRWLFTQRARLYYDGNNQNLPYICHSYNLMNGGLHTYGNLGFLRNRAARIFSTRNPVVDYSEVNHLLNIHAADRPHYVYTQNNIFSYYSSHDLNGMRSVDHYIETHIDRFYRILRFTLMFEYRANLTPGQDDPFLQAVPLNVLPLRYQQMVYNNETYRQLLTRERNDLNTLLERYGLRSQIEMGLIFASLNSNIMYFLQLYNSRFSTSAAATAAYGISNSYYTLLQSVPGGGEERLCLVLDYILVDWSPESLVDMIHDPRGQSLLRDYASHGLAVVLPLLRNPVIRLILRKLLLEAWFRRANLYFDGCHNESQYVPHRYTIDRRVYTVSENLSTFYARSTVDFRTRNPRADRRMINKFLQRHPSTSHNDYYSDYRNNPQEMTTAELYLETHIDQFYRIIYYFNLQNMRGVVPDDFLENLRIFLCDEEYGYAFQIVRTFAEMHMINNDQIRFQMQRNIFDRPVQNEDLILWLHLLASERRNFNLTNYKTSTTVNSSYTSTTPKTRKEKSYSLDDEFGEHSCKRSRYDFSGQNSDCQSQEQHTRQNSYGNKFYGYYEFDNDFDVCDLNKLQNLLLEADVDKMIKT